MNNEKNYFMINIANIKSNIQYIKDKYRQYEYYMAIVKADCYGLGYKKIVKSIDNMVSYFAVATLKEAINLRKITNKPILCLGIIQEKYLKICQKYNITITISNYVYLEKIKIAVLKNLKVHIKVNTGMNRLGVKDNCEFNKVYKYLKQNNINVEGIYTHIYDADNLNKSNKQVKIFEEITKDIILSDIKIIHICASDATNNLKRVDLANGIRMGINMYGLGNESLLSCIQLTSQIIQINTLNRGETLGYNGTFVAHEDNIKIGVIPLGYYNGIIRKYKGSYVFINNKKYEIVGNICMNMMFVKIDDDIKVGDKVYIIKDNNHLKDIAKNADTIPYEIICNIANKIERKYIYKECNYEKNM